MYFPEGSVNVVPEAFLESLGQGWFNAPDDYQVEVLSELDSLNQFATIRALVKQKPARAVSIFSSLLKLQEHKLVKALWLALEQDDAIDSAKLRQKLLKRSDPQAGNLMERIASLPADQASKDIELKYFRQALKDTVNDYKETKVGKNLMAVCCLMPPDARSAIWQELQANELYLLSTYIQDDQNYALYMREIPKAKLTGVVHEMKATERYHVLALILKNQSLERFKAALKGLYHMPDGISEFSDTRPVSDQGRSLSKMLEKSDLALEGLAPEKVGLLVATLLKDEEDRAICHLFKRTELSAEQIYAIDAALLPEKQGQGHGIKHLIETIHDHEGLWSLSTTTSRAYPIMQELKRLDLKEILTLCLDAAP